MRMEKPLKQFKIKVHTMPGLCSGRSATLSDDDEDIENDGNAIVNENFGNDFANRGVQVTMRLVFDSNL